MKRRLSVPSQLVDSVEDVSVIRNANFNRLWSAQILSQIAQNLLNFALIIRVFQLAQGTRLANISVALLVLSFGIPSVLFAAAAGVYVDHWNKKKVLLIVNFVRAVLVLGYLAFEHNLYMVLLLSFAISAATQFFTPAEAASIPALVTKGQLLRANSLFIFTMYASFIIGYSGSGPVIAAFGSRGPYILTSIMFGLAALLVWFLPNLHIAESKVMGFWRVVRYTGNEIMDNWKLIRATHNLRFPIAQLTIAQSTLGVIMVLAPALSQAVLGVPLQDSSHYFIFPAGIGMLTGVLLIHRISARFSHTRIIITGAFIASTALILLGLANQLHYHGAGPVFLMRYQLGLLVVPLTFALGFINAIVVISAQTILQEHTDESSRGKVFGALGMLGNIAATLPVFFAGILADLTSVQTVFIMLGCLLLAYGLGQFTVLRRRGQFV